MMNRMSPRRLLKPAGTLIVAMAVLGGVAEAQPTHAVPNNVKYRDAGIKPATGRSGSATLAARALIGMDGQTTIEATTGSFEGGAAPGSIAKMQMKAGGAAVNFNNLQSGGFWTHTLPGVSRGQQIQLQANITGIDPKRTGVVTVTTGAALRPDLTVSQLSGAQSAMINEPVTFVATLRELNGDVGARADCVISVDGQAVQQSDDIWVDAGGTVSCLFQTSFAAAGSYTVSAAALDVRPGDWNTANNSASTTIVVQSSGGTIPRGGLVAQQENVRADGCNSDYYYYYYNYCWDQRWNYSNVYFWGSDSSSQGQGLRTLDRIEVSLSSNNVTHFTASLTPIGNNQYDDGYSRSSCQWYSNYSQVWTGSGYETTADGNWFSACDWGHSGDSTTYRSYNYQHIQGNAVYHYNDYYWYNGLRTDSNTWGSGTDFGWSAGDAIRLNLAFVDTDGGRNTVDRSVTLEDRSPDVNYYYNYGYGWYRAAGNRYAGWINWWQ